MDNQEYEKAKAECWDWLCENRSVYGRTTKECFEFAFAQGYNLGKQEKDAEEILTIKKSSDKLKEGDIAICTYDTLTEVYITKVEETSYGIVYTTAYCIKGRIYFKRFHENYIIKK